MSLIHMGVHLKYPLFRSECRQNWIFSPDFRKKKSSNINFHKNPSSESEDFACGQTDVPNAILQIRFKMLVLIRNRTMNRLAVQPVTQSLSEMLLIETGAAIRCSTTCPVLSESWYRPRGKSERARTFIRTGRPEKWYIRNLGHADDLVSCPQQRPDTAADLLSRTFSPGTKR